jgi:hypothetical protein
LDAFIRLYDNLVQAASSKAQFDKLAEFVDEALDKYLTIIRIEAPGEEEAYWLFETLNDRGLALSVVDLLKNYLFRSAGSDRTRARKLWDSIGDKLGRVDPTTFVRHWWLSRHGVVREKEMFREIKQKYSDEVGVIDLLEELDKEAEAYAALYDSGHAYWSNVSDPYRTQIQELLDELDAFGITQCYPALLAVLMNVSAPKRMAQLFRIIGSVAVRFSFTASGRGSGSVEKAYSQAAMNIRVGKITTKDVGLSLDVINPPDDEFRSQCQQFSTKKKLLARHILARIAAAAQPGLGELSNPRKHTLEHILPKSPNKGWGDKFNREPEEFIHRLANMLLLEAPLNKKAERSDFESKKSTYLESEIIGNRQVGKMSDWDIDELQKRAQGQAKVMVGIWRVE